MLGTAEDNSSLFSFFLSLEQWKVYRQSWCIDRPVLRCVQDPQKIPAHIWGFSIQ